MSWSNLMDKLRSVYDVIMTAICFGLTGKLLWVTYKDFERFAPGFAVILLLLIVGTGAVLGVKDLRKS